MMTGMKGIMKSPLRLMRAHYLILILITGGLVWVLISGKAFSGSNGYSAQELLAANAAAKQACEHPELDMLNPLITKHINNLGNLTCASDPDWLYVEDGQVKVCSDARKLFGPFSCTISYYNRIDDFTSQIGDTETIESSEKGHKLKNDFFKAECKSKSKLTWESILAGIHRKESLVEKLKNFKNTNKEALGLNILIIGFDSMSHLHYRRKLPKTYSYITDDLEGVVLEGYNIVGDGTPQALIPILTGFAEPELPETRKRMPNANFVNIYPFAWKNFSDNGYVTAFAEDTPTVGIFTYRLKGFDEEPTDHYMRQFYVEANNVFSDHQQFCLGSLPRHKVMLNWVKQFYHVYNDVPKFAFMFHGELSHDDYNYIQYADNDIVDTLKSLKNDKLLDNTLLIMMSDHGHRFASIRETQQGKQEERLPFFAIIPPKTFKDQHKELYEHLKANSKKLATPFDIHSTLLTILNPNIPPIGNINQRSISLFSKIPNERSCADAQIEAHWCTCLSWEIVGNEEAVVKEAAQSVIDFINEYTQTHSSQCAHLILDKVTKAERLLPNDALLKYKTNKDPDGFMADLSDTTIATEITYQVQFSVFPSQGMYEASVKQRKGSSTFHVNEGEISRINLYGNQPDCVQEKFPNLRKYCYCKTHML